MEIKLHNTLSGKKEVFKPINEKEALMYNCGPTAYGEQHIGNLSMFVFTDILRRTLEYGGYKVKQVINITDFGHLSGDNEGRADEGEDRMTKGLRREKMALTMSNMRVLAEKYANIFFESLKTLNVNIEKTRFPFASDYIPDQIKMIQTLQEKGFTYNGENGVYFDTNKFPDYGGLGQINLAGLSEGARVEKSEKKSPTDFILWKKDKKIGWESPWGLGFPGWHIECSAMIFKLLGEQIDIHTGGIEHIPVHHNNEIAQAESASGKKPFVKFWLHRAHLKIDDSKISKSEGTAVYLGDFKLRHIHPLSFRFWLLTAHYKTGANFTWEGVRGAQTAFEKILNAYLDMPKSDKSDKEVMEKFEKAIVDDLNTPVAIAIMQEARSKKVIEKMDKVLGLNIEKLAKEIETNIPDEIAELKSERDSARSAKNWEHSDALRKEIEKDNFILEDKNGKSVIRKKLFSLI